MGEVPSTSRHPHSEKGAQPMSARARRRAVRAPKRLAWKQDGWRQHQRMSVPKGGGDNRNPQRPKPPSIALRLGKHSKQQVDRPRIVQTGKTKQRSLNKIARASRRRNRQ